MHVEKNRVGQFFVFGGLIFLILFAGSSQSNGIQVGYCCLSTIALTIGAILIWKDWKPPSQTARFRTLQKITRRKPGDKGNKG